ncbi:hypothetical protein BDN70DRAFT_879437 [Pholiota conissans]|uniref:Uncharacterized protein n=1 Tax=Pholiota conissans TaxID=109636 RepID=A0A9P5Z2C9_9AGAR|nr:hypothetical protein BDN70DRAFT_879437 [Pholiota conissans]
MDNPMQAPPLIHHNHVFDPALAHHQPVQTMGVEGQQQVVSSAEGSSAVPGKRRPGRPKGSTKKNLLASSPVPPKIKRPVGRPRKDGFPAGSVGPRVKRERTAQPHISAVQYSGVGYPAQVPYGYSISAPMPPAIAMPPVFQIETTTTTTTAAAADDWAELARTNPNAFLGTLLNALTAPNPVSSAGPSVEEAFKSHLVSLAPSPSQTQSQPIPSLYSILKTFWLPSSPAYFSLTASASTARTPSEHRFLYWDPQPLVFNGIACPNCSAPLINRGRISSGPVKIYDIEKPFFIVGCEYACRSPACVAATSPEGRKFASTDSTILRSLPMLLKDEFPARLLHGDADTGSGPNVWNWKAMGVSTGLWNLVMGALRAGVKKDVILRMIWAVQHKAPDGVGEPAAFATLHASGSGDQGHGTAAEDEKMDEDEDEDGEGDGEGEEMDGQPEVGTSEALSAQNQNQSQETQTLSSTNFQDAYGDAWKENTAMTEAPQPQQGVAAPIAHSVAASASATPVPHQHQVAVQQQQPNTPVPQQQQQQQPSLPQSQSLQQQQQQQQQHQQQQQQAMMAPPAIYPYTTYPFAAYMPHHIINGQIVPINVGQASGSSTPMLSASTSGSSSSLNLANAIPAAVAAAASGSISDSMATNAPDASNNAPSTSTIMPGPPVKRSPRHCSKCGSHDCKGKGGRSFCMSACQDCGKLECRGRNSRRPDKKCTEGWS